MAKGDMPNAASGAAFNPNMNTALRGAGSIGRFGSPMAPTGPGGTMGASFGNQTLNPGSVGPSQQGMQNMGQSMGMLGTTLPRMMPPDNKPTSDWPQGGVGPSNGGLEQLLKIFMNLQSHNQPNMGAGSLQTQGPQGTSQQAYNQYGMPRNRNV
jgi:hypothetical protein